MPRRPVSLSAAYFCSTMIALLLLAGPARAEDRKAVLPSDGEASLMKQHSAVRQRFISINKANEGEKANKDNKEDQTAIDVMAQYYTYRLTWDKLTGEPGGAAKLADEFYSQVNSADSEAMRKGNPAFSEMYLKALAKGAREVMQTRGVVAAVNGARMLARLAETGSEDAGDACLEALKNEKDFLEPKARAAVQYYALQGLKNLLGVWARTGGAGEAPSNPARKEREDRYLQALVEVIERKPPVGTNLSAHEEVEGLRVFRREAVRALAQYRNPAVADGKGVVKLPTALTLLKVINSDGLNPPARLDEQIEAAVGIGRLRSKALASYQPDYAAQQIGHLVVRMALQATAKDPPKFPWKPQAARLADALETMRAELKGSPDKATAEYVDKVVGLSLRVLKEGIELNERADGSNLNDFLVNAKAPHDTLYKGLADSTVRPRGKEDVPVEKPVGTEKKPDEKKPGEKKPGEKKPDEKKPMPGKP